MSNTNTIIITETAQKHFANLLSQQPEGTNIRVFVVNPGTQNAECGVSYCPPEAVEATDTELSFDHLTAYVDELSLPFLEDAEIDFVTDKMGSQLTLKAPNAKMRKVSDDASLVERVEYAIQTQVNPQLAGHGGHVSLVEITDDGIAIVAFGGGCNGCSMVDVTLKEGIEKELLQQFEGELSAVRDATEHDRGEHSYY
ncbi:Fe-S biogenesis protein NfuA [Vibrio salilacus]|uniref:Fe-S biogenesis protein NfuA n=1 Tax=Vibrio salilacus TaxID=1323749 RepID=UPI000C2A3A35|nr:Fe-S biogenesis protein NfuA [Vibrio salilacus]